MAMWLSRMKQSGQKDNTLSETSIDEMRQNPMSSGGRSARSHLLNEIANDERLFRWVQEQLRKSDSQVTSTHMGVIALLHDPAFMEEIGRAALSAKVAKRCEEESLAVPTHHRIPKSGSQGLSFFLKKQVFADMPGPVTSCSSFPSLRRKDHQANARDRSDDLDSRRNACFEPTYKVVPKRFNPFGPRANVERRTQIFPSNNNQAAPTRGGKPISLNAIKGRQLLNRMLPAIKAVDNVMEQPKDMRMAACASLLANEMLVQGITSGCDGAFEEKVGTTDDAPEKIGHQGAAATEIRRNSRSHDKLGRKPCIQEERKVIYNAKSA